ncbi:MAG: MarR family transcriptional regulator [Patescibacteria group bacterium]|jgi:DNA-binding MarR family transcriptional regulator
MFNRKKTIEEILETFHLIKRKSMNMVNFAKTADLNIMGSQWLVLHLVQKNDGIGVKEIAEEMHISSPAATQLVDALVTRGFLIRETSPTDRRAIKLKLSAQMRDKFADMKKAGMAHAGTLFESLDDDELATFMSLCKKLVSDKIDINIESENK